MGLNQIKDLIKLLNTKVGTPVADVSTDIATHDTDIKALVGTPVADLATDIAGVDTDLGTHDTDIKALVGTPVADLATDIAGVDTIVTIIENTIQHGGTVYFVGDGGSDVADGLTWATRKLTLAGADSAASAGDLVLIGTYAQSVSPMLSTTYVTYIGIVARTNVWHTGSISLPQGCVMKNISIEGTLTLAGYNFVSEIDFYCTTTDAITMANADWSNIENCRIQVTGAATGISITGAADNVTIKNNYISVADEYGIHINHASAREIAIIGNTINGQSTADAGIYIQAGSKNIIAGNEIGGFPRGIIDLDGDNYIADSVLNCMVNKSMPYLTEFFVGEVLDATVWDETLNGGTGAFTPTDGYMHYLLTTSGAGSKCNIITKYRWQSRPASFGDANTCINKLILEWEGKITDLANIVNASFAMGLGETADNDNTDNNIAIFTLDGSDNLVARTDNDGTDETSSTITATLTNWNKFRIEVYATGYKFYLNGALVATHETQVPDESMYLIFGLTDDTAGSPTLAVTNIRAWYEEVV